eukprot:11176961-Lingulodinium_polyedra.AAC.1
MPAIFRCGLKQRDACPFFVADRRAVQCESSRKTAGVPGNRKGASGARGPGGGAGGPAGARAAVETVRP